MGLIEDEDRIILDCYWLAEVYHQNPEVFLSMPVGDVRLHVARTMQLRAKADG